MIKLKINGQEQSWDGDPDLPLLWFLRDEVGLTGTKFGCGQALCGACTVMVDKDAVRSCITSVSDVVGREVSPDRRPSGSEGLARAERSAMRLLSSWSDHAGSRAADPKSKTFPRSNTGRDVGQHLPLRRLPAHRKRRPSRIDGSVIS